MPDATPRVLASVLNFNSEGQAITTVEHLLRQTWPALDVIVFDNASSDGSREAIEAAFPGLTVINTGSNLGYSGGNNAALEYGLAHGYDAVIVANHDVVVQPDAVERLVRIATTEQNVGVVGAQEVDAITGQNRVLGGMGYNFWLSRRRWIKDPGELNATGGPIPMDYVQGAFLLVTRRALEHGIRFSVAMFAYVDEIELGFQLARAGLRTFVDPGVAVWHKSRGKLYGLNEGYLMQRNRWYLVRHHGTMPQRIVNFLATALVELPVKALVRTAQGHPGYARAGILGFIDGVRGRMGIGRVGRLQ